MGGVRARAAAKWNQRKEKALAGQLRECQDESRYHRDFTLGNAVCHVGFHLGKQLEASLGEQPSVPSACVAAVGHVIGS